MTILSRDFPMHFSNNQGGSSNLIMRLKWKVLKWLVVVIFSCLFVGENLVFSITSYVWKIPIAKTGNSFKILFVSDPQIQGFELEPGGILGYITRWDACRYLKSSFSTAMNRVQPDIVVFLGDLFDEGYIASDETYNIYKEWFEDIFKVPGSVKRIFLAGDNDIGGESEPINPNFLKRHEKYFGPTNEIITINNWQFLKLNTLTFLRYHKHTPEEEVFRKDLDDFYGSAKKTLDKDKNTVVLTHLPVMYWDNNFSIEVMESLKPASFFSGNDHKSMYHMYEMGDKQYIDQLIPTCSYRMGTNFMGMGVAIFEADGTFQYSVLKLPARFFYLQLYLIVMVICIILVISKCLLARR